MVKKFSCPTEQTLALISGRWKVMIIYWLLRGTKRFNQLQRDLGSITHRTLSKQLRELEAASLIIRKDYAEIPPRVEYSLSPRGKSLEPILIAMDEWAVTNCQGAQPRAAKDKLPGHPGEANSA